MQKITTLEEAFTHFISDIYSAEKQLAAALPKLAQASSERQLVECFQNHLNETKIQIERLDQVVQNLKLNLQQVNCEAMEGLIEECQEVISEIEKGPICDVMLIAGCQKIAHYAIASYGCLVEITKQLGHVEQANLLQQTLNEEKAADEKLTQIAISRVNNKAVESAPIRKAS